MLSRNTSQRFILYHFVAQIGYAVFQGFSPGVIAATTGVVAGAVLAMLADTMIPEVFKGTRLRRCQPSRHLYKCLYDFIERQVWNFSPLKKYPVALAGALV